MDRDNYNNQIEGQCYEQKGNFGIKYISYEEIKTNVNFAHQLTQNKSEVDNNHQSFVINNLQSKSELLKKYSDKISNKKLEFELILSGETFPNYQLAHKKVENIFKNSADKLIKLGVKYELKIKDVKKGSIKIRIEGNPEDFNRLQELFKSGQLSKILGITVVDIRLVSAENLAEDTERKKRGKFSLVKEIKSKGAKGRNLKDVDLSDTNLSDTNLIRADLSGAKLVRANLTGAKLIRADLSDAELSSARLVRANLSSARLVCANLSSANINGADLILASLSNANLSGAKLVRANLYGADLSYANLILANLNNVNLSSANLTGANLIRANLRNTKIDEQTKLDRKWSLVREIVNHGNQGYDLNGVDLSGVDLRSSDLSFIDLSSAKLILADLRGVNLRNANLSDSDLSSANLSGANLSGANLSAANLTSTEVENTLFSNNLGISKSLKGYLIARGAIFK